MSEIANGTPWRTTEASAPFSLYVQLDPGTKADLSAISHASLALIALFTDLTFVADPSSDIRVELISSAEGSLWLNLKLLATAVKDHYQKMTLIGVAVVCIDQFALTVAQDAYHALVHELSHPGEDRPHLSDEDIEKIASKLAQAITSTETKEKVQNVYHALHSDAHISGVGAAKDSSKQPSAIVPRSEFAFRAGASATAVILPQQRTYERDCVVTLIRPVLLDDPKRRWGVRWGGTEFGVTIKDPELLHDVASGGLNQKLESNVQLEVIIRFKDQFIEGAWHTTDRTLLKVLRWIAPRTQGSMVLNSEDTPNSDRGSKKTDKQKKRIAEPGAHKPRPNGSQG